MYISKVHNATPQDSYSTITKSTHKNTHEKSRVKQFINQGEETCMTENLGNFTPITTIKHYILEFKRVKIISTNHEI